MSSQFHDFHVVTSIDQFMIQLYKLGTEHLVQIEQSKEYESYDRVAQYYHKLECIVGILENYHVFDVGMGLDGDGRGVIHRFHTFDTLYKKKAKEPAPSKGRS